MTVEVEKEVDRVLQRQCVFSKCEIGMVDMDEVLIVCYIDDEEMYFDTDEYDDVLQSIIDIACRACSDEGIGTLFNISVKLAFGDSEAQGDEVFISFDDVREQVNVSILREGCCDMISYDIYVTPDHDGDGLQLLHPFPK